MIQFFRKIRQSFIKKNKFSKYLVYAIGEIMLVVIGILIALQINNWNENRILKQKTKGYIENLKSDLINDTLNIDQLINYGKSHTDQINGFKSFFKQPDISINAKLDSSLKLNTPFYRYFPVNQTFLDMQSSGNSPLLSEEQRRSFIELGYIQQRLSIANEKIIGVALGEISSRNNYITEEIDFYEAIHLTPDQEVLSAALLHQFNYLYEIQELASVMNRFGTEIKQKSKKTILLLNNSDD